MDCKIVSIGALKVNTSSRVLDFSCCFNAPATTEIYTLSLHDALPIYSHERRHRAIGKWTNRQDRNAVRSCRRSEEHTSEFQSLRHLVCRLLLEKKKKISGQEIRVYEPRN